MAFDHFHGQGRKGADGATGATGAAGPNSITSATTTDFTAGLITSNGSGGITRTVVGGLGASLIAADFASEGQTALALVPGTNVQAYDGTLLAFAGLTIAANSLTIGTGADAFSQVSFAANTFPARASTGNLEAKTITDAALSALATGSWTSLTLVTPVLGTPTSGTLTNCTGYTFPNLASKPTTISGYGITNAWTPVFATADQSVTSSTVLVNSTYLTFSIPTGERWAFRGKVFFDTGASGDFKYDINASGAPTQFRAARSSIGNGATSFGSISTDTAVAVAATPNGTGTSGFIQFDGIIHNNTGGALTVTFRFAQNVSDGTATTVLAGSYLEYLKVT